MTWRHGVLLSLAVTVAAAIWSVGPLPQPAEYHRFADTRTLFGVPNFWNVVSNVPFALVGIVGLARVRGMPATGRNGPTPAWTLFFAGACLVGAGSAWYHLAPANAALVFDRLAIAVTTMALMAALVSVHVDARAGARLLWPAVAAGVASVLYWYWTETRGAGDLRAYAVAQFVPVVLIPAMLILFRGPGAGRVWALVIACAVARLCEQYDAAIFAWSGVTGGHALKHVTAALGMYFAVDVAAWRGARSAGAGAARQP
jgi:hypothetical protein